MLVNVGSLDRIIRFVVGAVLLVLGIFFFSGIWQWVAIVVGLIGLGTSITGFCLLYLPFGISTCPMKKGHW